MLATLYMNAVAFVFPSRYEGFGIPVLEAFQCGCPLIASNVSSLPEIAADAAIYFDPTDKESLRNAVEIVIHDRDMRNALVNKGYLRARDFSWEKVAQQTKDLYVKAASYPVNNTN
jgi:glycosyltransferase involved in cell wall biosynthesis